MTGCLPLGVKQKQTRRFQAGCHHLQQKTTCKNIWVFPKNRGFPPKRMVYNNGKPTIFLMGCFFGGKISPTLFGSQAIHRSGAVGQVTCWLPQKDQLQRERHLTWPCRKFSIDDQFRRWTVNPHSEGTNNNFTTRKKKKYRHQIGAKVIITSLRFVLCIQHIYIKHVLVR